MVFNVAAVIASACLAAALPNVLTIGLLVVCAATACIGVYRVVFRPNEWWQARERKEQGWFARHPRFSPLAFCLGLLGAGMLVLALASVLRRLI